MQRSHKIRLNPNNAQATYFAKACGCARLAYNWGLAEWVRQYEAGGKPSAFGLKKQFNAIKRQEFPWITEVTKCSPERAFDDLDRAFKNFFRNVKQGKKLGFPRFKKKGVKDSFYIPNDKFSIHEDYIKIPKLGIVRMTEPLRFQGKIMSAVVSKGATGWFASIAVNITDGEECSDNQVHSSIGVDLGVTKLATLSNGVVFENPRVTKTYEVRLRRLNKSLARKKKGSNNRKKAKEKLTKLHYKISCIRKDATHKMTHYLATNYSDICIEDLNVAGMVRNRKLAKVISDCSFAEIRRQLEYKAVRVHTVGRFFPSTKLCMNCGQLHEMPLSNRTFSCDCGTPDMDRDLHAAKTIEVEGLRAYTEGFSGFQACGDSSSGTNLSV